MKKVLLLSIVVLLAALSAADAASWKCSAKNLADGTYSGGGTAYIHLSPYKSGHEYPVTKKGKTATGVTQDGTKFTCRES